MRSAIIIAGLTRSACPWIIRNEKYWGARYLNQKIILLHHVPTDTRDLANGWSRALTAHFCLFFLLKSIPRFRKTKVTFLNNFSQVSAISVEA
jgi:hypothetical protein